MLAIHPKPGITLLAVEVSEDAHGFIIDEDFNELNFKMPEGTWTHVEHLPQPNGWQFIATTKSITEEQAAELVGETVYHGFVDYTKEIAGFPLATRSLCSLIRSQGGDPSTKNYAILIKQ